MTDRNKPGVAFWASVALVVVFVAYPLSTGPFVWLYNHGYLSEASAEVVARSFYGPITWICEHGPNPVSDAFEWYVDLWDTSP